jgi:hypothetical protein
MREFTARNVKLRLYSREGQERHAEDRAQTEGVPAAEDQEQAELRQEDPQRPDVFGRWQGHRLSANDEGVHGPQYQAEASHR